MNANYTITATHIIYTWFLLSGQTVTCSGGPYTYTAQFGSNGTAQTTTGDTYTVTTKTSTGVINTFSGNF